MGNKTSIAWTDATINLAWGCTKVSPGCDNCYMFRLSPMFGRKAFEVNILDKGGDYFSKKIMSCRNKGAKRIFINSMSDTFHISIDALTISRWIDTMRASADIQFQILTKRSARMIEFVDAYEANFREMPQNVWLGVSVESSKQLYRIKDLQKLPAHIIKFISFEPLLENIPLSDLNLDGIDWVIVGGESDAREPRPMDPDWAWAIQNQCVEKNIPFFFKQMGGLGGDGAGGDKLYGWRFQNFPK